MTLKLRKTDIFISVLMIFSLFLHRGYFYQGTMTKGDWAFSFKELMTSQFSFSYAWASELSISIMKIRWFTYYPVSVLSGFLANFFSFDYNIIERIFLFFPVTFLPALSMYYLSSYLFKNRIVCFFSAILYSSNTLILLWSIAWLPLAIVYSLAPLILALFIQSLRERSLRKTILTSIIFAISMTYEPRITCLTAFILILYFLFINILERNFSNFIHSLKISAIFGITTMALEAYWVLPFLFGGGRETFSSILPSKPWISFSQLIHAFTLRYPWYTITGEIKSFVVPPVNPIFFIIPLIAFSAILLRKKDKNIIFFSVVALIGIFLVKGENPPFGFIYTWLFKNFPGFNLYRESAKFFPLIALAYSVLFGVAVSDLGKIIGRKIKCQSKIAVICFFSLIFSSQIIMAWPALAYQMKTYTGLDYYPSLPAPPEDYIKIKRFITEQPSGFKTLWLPEISRFSFYTPEYPVIPIKKQGGRLSQTDIKILSDLMIPPVSNNYLSRLFAAWNIKYVILSPETELDHFYGSSPRTELDHLYGRFPQEDYVDFLNEQEGLRRVHVDEGIYVYENTLYSQSRFFILEAEEKYFLNKRSIETFDFENGLDNWSINSLNKQKLFLSNISYSEEHSLGVELNTSDWGWKVVSSPLIQVECGSQYMWQLYVKGENAYEVHMKIAEYDSSRNWIKTHYKGLSSDGTFDWKEIIINFVPISPNMSYVQLQVWHGHETNKQLPNKVWLDDNTLSLIHSINEEDKTLKDMLSPNGSAEIVEYKEINPTRYIVKVNGTEPFILSFAESYDPLWIAEVDGEIIRTIQLYSGINSFWINQTGELTISIEYEPQRWFYYGFAISITTMMVSVVFLVWDWKKRSYKGSKFKEVILWLKKKLQIS